MSLRPSPVVLRSCSGSGGADDVLDLLADAQKVLRKHPQIMMDEEFPQDYELTVFPFSEDVFFYISNATLDLSLFDGEAESLMKKLRSSHRSIRFTPLPGQRKALIEGPFCEVKALRERLLCSAKRLQKYNVSTQSSQEPRQDGAEAQGASSGGTEEPATNEREQRGGTGSVSDTLRKNKAEPLQRQVVGQDSIEKISSSLQALHLLPASGPQQPQEEEESVDSSPSTTETPQAASRSAGTLPAVGPEDFWVDLLTFNYVNTFHKNDLDECLRNVKMTTMCLKESDIVQVSLSELQPSHGPSRTREASEELKAFFEAWQCTLEVHEVQVEQHNEKVMQICRSVGSQYDGVLYTLTDSRLRIVGPHKPSYKFYRQVQDLLTELYYSDHV